MSNKGRQIQSVIDKAQKQHAPGVITHDAARDDVGNIQGGATANNLPRRFGNPAGDWDNQVELKRQLMADAGGPDTPFGQVQFSDRDARALLEKKRAGEAAAFDGWFGKQFNTNDLPTRLLGEQLNPEYFQAREDQLVNKAELALRLQLMKLRGPRSEEDLMIIWGLQSGNLVLDEQWDRISFDDTNANAVDGDNNKARFSREVNSVSRFFMGRNARNQDLVGSVNPNNPSVPFGVATNAPTDSVANQMFGPAFAAAGGGTTQNLSQFFNFLKGN